MKLVMAKFRPLAGTSMTLLRFRSLEHRQQNLILEKQHFVYILEEVKGIQGIQVSMECKVNKL